ncbi:MULTISPECIES: hypothetical protein [Mycobacterium]|uniref:TetR family transcriptional regulator n=1 Tax=Mycobacterium paraintracellulare TaxID=1138383 RepID=A0ABN6AUT9_9MYCO|nr:MULTISPECIES: hypothetical protein [Mycobacterium]AFC54394.1 hypothetical protein OCQ_28820 [Mycobacterium paraintracellulare]WSE54350.1 hypothetical protein QGN31_12000 [Mycobacterium sp. 2-64]BBY72562.1 hypothetical protein MPRI_47490 [Mycobacterium paraintracellulare]BCO89658.1 hypothetical protein MINTM015_29150 [Mycobacterium paraintracellulare]
MEAQRRWAIRIGRNLDRTRGTALGDPVSQGSALEAMLESLWFSSTMDDSRRGKQAALSTAIAMGEALIAR